MGLQERIYSILVVSAAESFNSALAPLLPESRYDPVVHATSVAAARRALAERSFDFVLVNAPLPDDPGTNLAIDSCTADGTVVLLLVKNDIYAGVYDRVVGHGVFTLPKPTSRPAVMQALSWMISARERLRRLEKKALPLQEKMEEIRLVNRAKWLLISQRQMSEPDAHHYIEKHAMDRCISKRMVAEEIIKAYS